jgi:hypothetical protein
MSTRKKGPPDSFIPTESWRRACDHSRREAMRVIDTLRAGQIDEHDLDSLTNFLQFSLALMEMEGPNKWALAKINAELLAIQHHAAS